MIENIIYLLIAFASVSIIGGVSETTLLNSFLKRAVGGITVNITAVGFIQYYTNIISFYLACSQGLVGLPGFVFIFANVLLAIVWANNLVKYRQAVV